MQSLYELHRRLKDNDLLIVGAGRIALAARYMFGFIGECYIALKDEQNTTSLKRLTSVESELKATEVGETIKSLPKSAQGYFIVLCSYHEKDICASLECAEFIRGRDFVSVFELALLLDFPAKFYEHQNYSLLIDDNADARKIAAEFNADYHTDYPLITLESLEKKRETHPPLIIIYDRSKKLNRCMQMGGGTGITKIYSLHRGRKSALLCSLEKCCLRRLSPCRNASTRSTLSRLFQAKTAEV